ncbi:unnamed protein product, partial [Brassica napus]
MDSEIVYDFSPVFIIYKSGRIERLTGETIVQSSLTPHNGVVSKDVVYSPGDNLSVRIFLPEKAAKTGEKLPLLQCRWITGVHRSIPFRSLYDDSWTSLKWVFTHIAGCGPENW